MSFQINSNLEAFKAYNSLAKLNSQTQKAQLRLATGKRINSVADDTSGYAIGKSLESKTFVQKSQLNNVSVAQNYLSTAETALVQINDLITQISAKYADSQNALTDRTSIANDIRSIAAEIDSILKNTKYNDKNLLAQSDGSALSSSDVFDVGSDVSMNFASDDYLKADVLKTALHGSAPGVDSYTGASFNVNTLYSATAQNPEVKVTYDDGTTESFQFSTGANEVLNIAGATLRDVIFTANGNLELSYTDVGDPLFTGTLTTKDNRKIVSFETTSGLDILDPLNLKIEASGTSGGLLSSDTATVLSSASDVSAISRNVKNALGRIGNLSQTLNKKSDFLSASITNNQSSISRLFDADMAAEQLNAVKGNIAGNAATSMLSQLNMAPQSLLSLF